MFGLQVLPANIQDPAAAKLLLEPLATDGKLPRLRKLWVDGIYGGSLLVWVQEHCGWELEVVTRPPGTKGFLLLPKRWTVERTFAWFLKWRRLRTDYEYLIPSAEAWIRLAMTALMLRRLGRVK